MENILCFTKLEVGSNYGFTKYANSHYTITNENCKCFMQTNFIAADYVYMYR